MKLSMITTILLLGVTAITAENSVMDAHAELTKSEKHFEENGVIYSEGVEVPNGTAYGFNALAGSNGVSVGADAKGGTGSWNIAVGHQAGLDTSTGGWNVSIGAYTGYSITTGSHNILLGPDAGENLTTTLGNTMMGVEQVH